MLATIKNILLNTSGHELAEYYQSRLQQSSCVVEVEAILNMNTLMAFNEDEGKHSESI